MRRLNPDDRRHALTRCRRFRVRSFAKSCTNLFRPRQRLAPPARSDRDGEGPPLGSGDSQGGRDVRRSRSGGGSAIDASTALSCTPRSARRLATAECRNAHWFAGRFVDVASNASASSASVIFPSRSALQSFRARHRSACSLGLRACDWHSLFALSRSSPQSSHPSASPSASGAGAEIWLGLGGQGMAWLGLAWEGSASPRCSSCVVPLLSVRRAVVCCAPSVRTENVGASSAPNAASTRAALSCREPA